MAELAKMEVTMDTWEDISFDFTVDSKDLKEIIGKDFKKVYTHILSDEIPKGQMFQVPKELIEKLRNTLSEKPKKEKPKPQIYKYIL